MLDNAAAASSSHQQSLSPLGVDNGKLPPPSGRDVENMHKRYRRVNLLTLLLLAVWCTNGSMTTPPTTQDIIQVNSPRGGGGGRGMKAAGTETEIWDPTDRWSILSALSESRAVGLVLVWGFFDATLNNEPGGFFKLRQQRRQLATAVRVWGEPKWYSIIAKKKKKVHAAKSKV